MIRKLALALGATIVLAAAALSPTTASAWGHGHHWRGGYGFGYYGPTYIAAPDCYIVKKQVLLSDGTLRWRRFTVCN
mgnify:CR=1 FL=1|jgi:hypothetical protein